MCDTPPNSVSWPEKRFEKEIKDARDASSAGLRALLTLNEVGPCLRTVVATGQFDRCPSLFCDDTQHDDDDDGGHLVGKGEVWVEDVAHSQHRSLAVLRVSNCKTNDVDYETGNHSVT